MYSLYINACSLVFLKFLNHRMKATNKKIKILDYFVVIKIEGVSFLIKTATFTTLTIFYNTKLSYHYNATTTVIIILQRFITTTTRVVLPYHLMVKMLKCVVTF